MLYKQVCPHVDHTQKHGMAVLLVKREGSAVILRDPFAKIAPGLGMIAHILTRLLLLDSHGILRMTPPLHALHPGCFGNTPYPLLQCQQLNLKLLS